MHYDPQGTLCALPVGTEVGCTLDQRTLVGYRMVRTYLGIFIFVRYSYIVFHVYCTSYCIFYHKMNSVLRFSTCYCLLRTLLGIKGNPGISNKYK